MPYVRTALLLVLGGALGACNSSPSNHQPVTGDHPLLDTTTTAVLDTAAPASGAVPFVAPTPAGRVLGDQSPSPPASRTH